MLQEGILENFVVRFKSIQADCDRYSAELFRLFEAGTIERAAYFELSAKGALWIILQYNEAGYLDEVEAHVRKGITSRDLYGPLHDNSVATLEYLKGRQEYDRVYRLFRAAIEHRLRALKDEAKTRDNGKQSKTARSASAKWVQHHLPAARKMVQQYETLLESNGHSDPQLSTFKRSLIAVSER